MANSILESLTEAVRGGIPDAVAQNAPNGGGVWTWTTPLGQACLQWSPATPDVRWVAPLGRVTAIPAAQRAEFLTSVAHQVMGAGWLVPAIEADMFVLVGVQRVDSCTPENVRSWTLELQAIQSRMAVGLHSTVPSVPIAEQSTPNWSDPMLRGSGVVAAWVKELAMALADEPAPVWPLSPSLQRIGRGAILQTDSEQVAVACAQRVATDLGLPFVPTSFDNLAETLLALRATPRRVVVYMGGDLPWADARKDEEPLPTLSAESLKDDSLSQMLSSQVGRQTLIRWLLCRHGLPSLILLARTTDVAGFSETLSVPGIFDRRFALSGLTPTILGRRFLQDLGEELCGPSLLEHPAKVEFLLRTVSGRQRLAVVHHLRRLYLRLNRRLEFSDLVAGYHSNFVEQEFQTDTTEAEQQARTLVAYHEAGHAVMSMIISEGRQVPEHATIIGSTQFAGFVLPSLEPMLSAHDTFGQFRNRVRTSLAGRAAEEIVFGPDAVTTGAHGDLSSATELTTRYFAMTGFGPMFGEPGGAGDNLAVWDLENPYLRSEMHQMVRRWLASEYAEVKQALQHHRRLLDATARALLTDPVQDQGELRILWETSR